MFNPQCALKRKGFLLQSCVECNERSNDRVKVLYCVQVGTTCGFQTEPAATLQQILEVWLITLQPNAIEHRPWLCTITLVSMLLHSIGNSADHQPTPQNSSSLPTHLAKRAKRCHNSVEGLWLTLLWRVWPFWTISNSHPNHTKGWVLVWLVPGWVQD